MNRYITLDTNKKVDGVRYGDTIVDGEIESILGEIGQIQQPDGSFINDTTPLPPQPKSEVEIDTERIIAIEQAINMLMGM